MRYFRNARNLGAGPNYDNCFHKARGVYFKWAAHDDCLAPAYLTKAVAALDAAPDAVLCTVGITEIGSDGEVLRTYANSFPGVSSPSAAVRFGAVIHARHQCEDFFGLYRRAALVGSGLHALAFGGDFPGDFVVKFLEGEAVNLVVHGESRVDFLLHEPFDCEFPEVFGFHGGVAREC